MMKTQSYKKGWAFTLTLVLVVTTLLGGFGSLGIKGVVGDVYAFPASTPTPYSAGAPAGTTGAPTTYAITTEVQLRGLATTVSDSSIQYENTTFELTNDINITGDWIPIGTSGKPFSGTFDGKNFEITGIQIGTSGTPESTYGHVGLFGNTSGSAIKNLGVNVQINSSKGSARVGGLVGFNSKGTITNCYSTGNVVGGSEAYVGGLVGQNFKATINNCYATSNLSGANGATYPTYVGGLVGWNREGGTINNCYATGDVTGGDYTCVGGLVGKSSDGTITNCYATGNITAGSDFFVGGLVGGNQRATITNCYATGGVTGGSNAKIGGLAGYHQTIDISKGYWNSNAIQMLSGAAVVNKLGVGEIYNGTVSTTSMSSMAMKDLGFVTTLNNWVSNKGDSTYYTWKAAANDSDNGGYPLLDKAWEWTPTYTMGASSLTEFMSQTEGYGTAPATQTVTITNTGNQPITLTQPTSTNYTIGTLSTTNLTVGGTATFTVQPKTGLAVGSYNETINITGSNSATTSVSVQFAVTTVSTHTMSASTLTEFASQTEGYGTAPATQTVTITNNGNQPITLTQPTSTNYTIGTLSTTTLTVGGTATFTVQPKTGLAVGSYNETINITGSNSTTTSVSVQFSVTAAGGSGSSSGGSGSSGSSSTATTVIKTNTGSITGAQLKNAADVAKDGETVTIKSDKTSGVTLPTSGLDSLAGKNNSLTVVTDNATLTFNSKAVAAMGTQAAATDIKVIVDDVVKTTLTADQQTKVGDKTVYDLSVISGGKLISNFNGGKVNVSIPYELKAGEKAENLKVWYMADNGSLTEINCTYDTKNKSVTFVVDHFSKYIIGYDDLAGWANPFTDVKSSAWYYNAAAFVNVNGLMKGQTDTDFGPQGAMTRGMFVAILGRMEGIDSTTYADKNTFSDVKSSQYYAPYIAWASDKGIVTGMGGDQFAPNAAVTREQMAVMMTNYMKFKGQGPTGAWAIQLTYGDLDKVSSWANEGVMFMTMKDLMKGTGKDEKGNTLFDPKETSTRAQTAQVMMNLGELLK